MLRSPRQKERSIFRTGVETLNRGHTLSAPKGRFPLGISAGQFRRKRRLSTHARGVMRQGRELRKPPVKLGKGRRLAGAK